MNRNKIINTSIITLISILFFLPTVSGEHIENHDEFELEEGYFQVIDLDENYGYSYEVVISSSHKIDAVVLTDSQYQSCCSGEVTEEIRYTDSRSKVSVKDASIIVEENQKGFVLIIDNSEAVVGGEIPTQKVTVEILYLSYGEIEYKFKFGGFFLGFIFLPLIVLTSMDLFFNLGFSEKLPKYNDVTKEIDGFIKFLQEKYPNNLLIKYPALTLIVGLNVIWYLIGIISGIHWLDGPSSYEQAINQGATSIVELAQFNLFSVISSNFMHFGFLHLFGNMVGICFLGDYIERELGSIKFLSLIFFTALCTSLFAIFEIVLAEGYVIGGGASGILFGLVGMISGQLIIGKVKNIENYCKYPDMRYFWSVAGVSAVTNLIYLTNQGYGISVLAHLGGFVGGLTYSLLVIKTQNEQDEIVLNKIDDEEINEINSEIWKLKPSDMLFSFEGRLNRSRWWIAMIIVGIFGFIFQLSFEYIISLFLDTGFLYSTLILFLYIPILYINAALSIKRLKDSDKGWEWGFLIIVICIVNALSVYLPRPDDPAYENFAMIAFSFVVFILWISFMIPLFILCGFIKGTEGGNRFGPDPLIQEKGFIITEQGEFRITLNEMEMRTFENNDDMTTSIIHFFSEKRKIITKSWEKYIKNKKEIDENDELTDFEKWIVKNPILFVSLQILSCAIIIIFFYLIVN